MSCRLSTILGIGQDGVFALGSCRQHFYGRQLVIQERKRTENHLKQTFRETMARLNVWMHHREEMWSKTQWLQYSGTGSAKMRLVSGFCCRSCKEMNYNRGHLWWDTTGKKLCFFMHLSVLIFWAFWLFINFFSD